MNIDFSSSSKGFQVVKINGIPLHSQYNPLLEAQRFVDGIQVPFNPKAVIITGPGLSYTAEFLRKRFPKAILTAIHFLDKFEEYDSVWDKVFFADQENLSERLYNFLGDEVLMSTIFISWKPSESIFSESFSCVWMEMKNAVLKARNVLNTKSHFSKKWFTNTIKSALYIKTSVYYTKAHCPVVICASGPSLMDSIPLLKKSRNGFFLIALSSSLKILTDNHLIPDFVLSTDGGFWAKKHIFASLCSYPQIPLALPGEAACPGKILENNLILPLKYSDGFENYFYPDLGIESHEAEANGTVSGTAVKLALNLTDGEVFFCGLDLAAAKGYQHSQSNELELFDSSNDWRLSPKENRISPKGFKNQALEIYNSWFRSQDFGGRVFRLSNNYNYSNNLGQIKDVNFNYFEVYLKSVSRQKPSLEIKENKIPLLRRIEIIKSILEKNKNNPVWIEKLFPAEKILLERSLNQEETVQLKEDLNSKIFTFFEEIREKLCRISIEKA